MECCKSSFLNMREGNNIICIQNKYAVVHLENAKKET